MIMVVVMMMIMVVVMVVVVVMIMVVVMVMMMIVVMVMIVVVVVVIILVPATMAVITGLTVPSLAIARPPTWRPSGTGPVGFRRAEAVPWTAYATAPVVPLAALGEAPV